MNNIESLRYFAPEIILVLGVIGLILFDLIFSARKALPYLTLGILFLAFILVLICLMRPLPRYISLIIYSGLMDSPSSSSYSFWWLLV